MTPVFGLYPTISPSRIHVFTSWKQLSINGTKFPSKAFEPNVFV